MLLLKIVFYFLVIYCLFCIILYSLQNYLIYYPQDRRMQDPQYAMCLKSAGAQIIVTRKERAGEKALIYFGGNAEDVSLYIHEFEREFPDYSLYLMHYRGWRQFWYAFGKNDL